MNVFYFQRWRQGGYKPKIQDGWRPKTIWRGPKALESADIASQQTHCEPTDATDVDVVTNVTPTCKGLDKAN